jgi:HK97 family phage prohead protease
MDMEYKSASVEFKATGDEGQYEGHFSIFGNVDDGCDVAHEGMFLKTISERSKRVKVFYAHDWSKLIGPPPAVLQEDKVGLFASGRLTLDSFWGKEAWALMRDGALTEGSFGYEAVKFDFEDLPGDMNYRRTVRHLREVKLYEISPVPLGMNALTEIRAVKAAILKSNNPQSANPQSSDGSNNPDEMLVKSYLEKWNALVAEMKEGRVLSTASREKVSNAISAMEGAMAALNDLLTAAEPQKNLHSALLEKRLRAAECMLAQFN